MDKQMRLRQQMAVLTKRDLVLFVCCWKLKLAVSKSLKRNGGNDGACEPVTLVYKWTKDGADSCMLLLLMYVSGPSALIANRQMASSMNTKSQQATKTTFEFAVASFFPLSSAT
ncbi:uncharacterized protein SPSK_10072 [Sporothrix schenckii 1099-18]|uniref:Uncharacterized protein n=1 Tax=Sporothrix schenckii 1099-18 TaxID=1397361 RepID=A0A0F2MA53_SPOSC|nr:uncharacterized protein SPSK_10072 [Sporothrix schenckii 1099-18]KJR85041.1 hypothetical protein SPSK_10072 [Sporothrix schenckii 1099-18]